MNDLILIESQSARNETMLNVSDDRAIEHLNKAKALTMALWQGTGIATTKQMAEYYEISEDTVQTFVKTNRDELLLDGLKTIKGKELRDVVSILNTTSEKTPSLTIWTPRAALRLGMLLRDSLIAKAVRTVILNIVESVTHPRQANTLAIRKLDLQIEIKKLELQKLELQREDYKTLPTPPAIPIQLDLDIEERFKRSQQDLLKAKALENEYKTSLIEQKLKPKQYALSNIDNVESVEAYLKSCLKLDPSAKAYIGKADGNPNTHLYPNYVNYCVQQGLSFVPMQCFSKVLRQLAYTKLEVRLSKGRDRVGCHINGIAIAA